MGRGPVKLYCDKFSASNIGHNPIHMIGLSTLKIDRHFIKEKLEGLVCMPYV